MRDQAAAVIGASFTGLEVATELRKSLPPGARIVLVDRGARPEVALGETVQRSNREALALTASSLTADLGARLDRDGRLDVDEGLHVPGLPFVFAAGDTARAPTGQDRTTLMSCQHAVPMGLVAGRNAVRDLAGLKPIPFDPVGYVTCLDLGPWGAVFTHGWDRKIVSTGLKGKEMKDKINRKWIYPPDAVLGRAEIFRRVIGTAPTLGTSREIKEERELRHL